MYLYIYIRLYTHRYHTISDDLYHRSIFVDGYAKIQPNTPAARCFLAEAAAVLSTRIPGRDVPNSQWLMSETQVFWGYVGETKFLGVLGNVTVVV